MLTAYGRVIEGSVLPAGGDTDPNSEPSTGFLFGLIKTPEQLSLGGELRGLWLRTKVPGSQLTDRVILMQADLQAAVRLSSFVASGSLGYASEGALGAALTRGVDNNLVSRQHWLGYAVDSLGLLVRAGRMNLPFGIRTVEHNLWAKSLTRTTINDDQQYGAALAITGEKLRGELMAIIGNFQLRPDDYRERGYSGYLEWAALPDLSIGASSLITHRQLDTATLKETWRQSHGVFGRWATGFEPLVLQTEWDYVFVSSRDEYYRRGPVAFLQADLEVSKGMHWLFTAETNHVGSQQSFWGHGGWLSYWWFFAPHADLRLDGIYQSLGSLNGRYGAYSVLLQGHISL